MKNEKEEQTEVSSTKKIDNSSLYGNRKSDEFLLEKDRDNFNPKTRYDIEGLELKDLSAIDLIADILSHGETSSLKILHDSVIKLRIDNNAKDLKLANINKRIKFYCESIALGNEDYANQFLHEFKDIV